MNENGKTTKEKSFEVKETARRVVYQAKCKARRKKLKCYTEE